MRDDLNISEEIDQYSDSDWLLFDAWHANAYGGTGKRFNWVACLLFVITRSYSLGG